VLIEIQMYINFNYFLGKTETVVSLSDQNIPYT